MDNQTKKQVLNLLGLARRAGKLITGEELVIKAIQKNQVYLIFLATEASANLSKKIGGKAKNYQLSLNQKFSDSELSQAIGAQRKVLAITDKGFAQKMEKLLLMM